MQAAKIEAKAKAYAAGDACRLGYCQSYELADTVTAHGVEVFSLLRDSDPEPDDHVTAFLDTGDERARGVGAG